MTEIALRHDRGAEVAAPVSNTLADWARELQSAGELATALCRTAFVPEHFRGKPEEAAAAILTGHELGLSPMAALRAIFVIKGTPGMYAKAMVAVLQSQGHQVWVSEQSDDRVVVCGRRKGTSEVISTTWDRERVVKAKLTANAKYQETPQQMMVARGQAEICRQIAADALHGVPYSAEELADMDPVRVEATVAPRARVTAAEILDQAQPEEEAGERRDEPAVEMMTDKQSRMMFALLTKAGKTDRDIALVYIAGVVGRPIESRRELTKVDAGRVIDALEAVLQNEAS